MKTLLCALPIALALTSCETTGDPNAGGYFGWSPEKAKQREAGLRGELDIKNQTNKDLKSKRDSLISQRNSLRSQVAAAKRKVAAATTPAEKKKATVNLSNLNRELALLENSM